MGHPLGDDKSFLHVARLVEFFTERKNFLFRFNFDLGPEFPGNFAHGAGFDAIGLDLFFKVPLCRLPGGLIRVCS